MRILFVTFLFLLPIALLAQSAAQKYIDTYSPLALEVSEKYQIPPSLVLGIALHESASGTSKLCRTKRNHFGVKGRVKSSKSKSGYVSAYRTFESDEASYLHIGEMISKRKYYTRLKGDMDYMKWLKAMKASGYARSSSWVSVIDKTIKRYDLTRLDKPFNPPVLHVPSPRDTLIRIQK